MENLKIKIRIADENDLPKISEWLAQEPDHAGRVDPEFFVSSNGQNIAVEDESGVVFYARIEKVARLHLQFAPEQKLRTAKALSQFLPAIAEVAKQEGAQELVGETPGDKLAKFGERFGWKSMPNERVKNLR